MGTLRRVSRAARRRRRRRRRRCGLLGRSARGEEEGASAPGSAPPASSGFGPPCAPPACAPPAREDPLVAPPRGVTTPEEAGTCSIGRVYEGLRRAQRPPRSAGGGGSGAGGAEAQGRWIEGTPAPELCRARRSHCGSRYANPAWLRAPTLSELYPNGAGGIGLGCRRPLVRFGHSSTVEWGSTRCSRCSEKGPYGIA